jgi:hypothetical protein
MSEWICQRVNSDGERCQSRAVHRLQFSQEHPFDFIDVCEEHLGEYTDYLWEQYLREELNGGA